MNVICVDLVKYFTMQEVSLKRLTPFFFSGLETNYASNPNNLFQLIFEPFTITDSNISYLFTQISPVTLNESDLMIRLTTIASSYSFYITTSLGLNLFGITNEEGVFLQQCANSFISNQSLPSLISTSKVWLTYAYYHWLFLLTNTLTYSNFQIQTSDYLANYITYKSSYMQIQYVLNNKQVQLT